MFHRMDTPIERLNAIVEVWVMPRLTWQNKFESVTVGNTTAILLMPWLPERI